MRAHLGLAVLGVLLVACNADQRLGVPDDTPRAVGDGSPPCGDVRGYLKTLEPALLQWEADVDVWLAGDVLDTLPGLGNATSEAAYLADLTTTLTAWEDSLETERATDFLDTVTPFDDEAAIQTYLADLSALLAGWRTAIETWRGEPFLDEVAPFVPDVTPPEIVCVPDLVVVSTDGNDVAVDYEVTATDDCEAAPTITCDPAPGTLFPLGETEVTCTGTDAVGNVATCTFSVAVTLEPPTITCPDDLIVTCAPDAGATVTFEVVAADGTGEPLEVTSDPASGSTFPIGETVVTSTATDRTGVTVSCAFTVTVVEATPPEIEDVIARPSVLWPPNHRMVEVDLEVVLGESCGEVACEILEVTSNEPIDGLGDGSTEPDWMVTDDGTLHLRAERSGTGSGRVYTVEVSCVDELGEETRDTVLIRVPHDRS